MINIVLRTVQVHDSERISEIYGYHVDHGLASWEYDPPRPTMIRERMARLTAKGYPYIVAMLDNEVIGYAYAGSYRERPGYKYVVENSIYVDHNYSRMGIGRQLLARLITDCTSLGYRHMLAVIGDSNNIESIKLHASLGFTHVGTLPKIGFKMNQWVDSYLMHRPLGQGSSTKP
jgi:L-amino acid N-acyltransferase YncA